MTEHLTCLYAASGVFAVLAVLVYVAECHYQKNDQWRKRRQRP